jgi:hypothetical protein
MRDARALFLDPYQEFPGWTRSPRRGKFSISCISRDRSPTIPGMPYADQQQILTDLKTLGIDKWDW